MLLLSTIVRTMETMIRKSMMICYLGVPTVTVPGVIVVPVDAVELSSPP